MKRDKYCGEINLSDVGRSVKLCGWIHRIRDHGGVIFLDLRDRTGIVQCVIEEKDDPDLYEKVSKLNL